MELDGYIRAIVRMWYLPLALLALAISGSWLYLNETSEAEATATVAVLEPRAPIPGEYIPPRLNFDLIGDSEELANRVAARLDDGATGEEIKGQISITRKPTLDRAPVYLVSATDKDQGRAIEIADIAVAEARILYAELNTPTVKDVRAVFQPELERAIADEAAARAAFSLFVIENNAYALPLRTNQQIVLISQLRSSIYTSSDANDQPASESAALSSARSELDRLTSLGGEFDRLAFEAGLAEAAVRQLESQVSQLAVSGSPEALAAAESELGDARARQATAQGAFEGFKQQHAVSDLPAAIQSQLVRVNDLAVADASSSERIGARQDALSLEEAELQRLVSLEQEYTQLDSQLEQAEALRQGLDAQILSVVIGQTLPTESRVTLLESAVAVSGAWWTMITYALAIMLAIFLSLSLVYLFAYFERLAPSSEELQRAFGAPILMRIPKAANKGD